MEATKTKTQVLSASTLTGDPVKNTQGEDLGDIKELMIDVDSGRIAYAVLSFGGFMGMGDKLFAVPWSSMRVEPSNERLILDVAEETLRNAPGFDKDSWPDTGDDRWMGEMYDYYGAERYW